MSALGLIKGNTNDPTEGFTKQEKALLSRLSVKGSHGFSFVNWAKTFSSVPKFYLAPETEADIIQLIHICNRYKLVIKPIGSGHSPSDLACTDSVMLNMDKMKRILAIDSHQNTITVESGVRFYELHEMLKQRNMALSCIGSISDQSVAGAIATATHGTGMGYSDLSSAITSLVIINGLGDRIECSAQTNGDLFDAARCSLGALGIITQVTIQCEPAFTLHAVQTPDKLDYVLYNLSDVVHSAEHVRFWWFPHTDDVVVWRANRSQEPHRPSPESYLRDRLYGFHYYQLQLFGARFAPDSIPSITKEHYAHRFDRKLEWVDDSYKVFNFDCLFPQYVNEWAIPWENTSEALKQLRGWINSEHKKPDGARVHFPIEVRFVRENDVWLSPAYQRTVCYIGVIMYRPYHKAVPYKKYWKAYEDIMRTLDGRPHWAKAHKMYYYDLKERYPMFGQFVEMRRACDPNNIFVNDYIRRHILSPSEQVFDLLSSHSVNEPLTFESPKL